MQYGKFAKLYDALMSDVDDDGWASYVSGFLKPGSTVLECACGTGEMSFRLVRQGHSVTATDISEDMLMVAAEKQRSLGLAGGRLRFARMDMRALSFHKKADCVAAFCDGVNYLPDREDVKRFFSSANAVLKPGGLLLFDVSSRYKLKEVLGNNCFMDNGPDTPYMWQNYYDGETKLLRMELSFFVNRGGLYERFDETHIQRAHSLRELTSWLTETGFEPSAYAFLTKNAPDDRSERIQFAARKIF